MNIATKDVATGSIQESLLNVRSLGLSQIADFLDRSLTSTANGKTKVKFHDPMKKNKSKTVQALYKAAKVEDVRKKVAKMDRPVKAFMQRLIVAYEAGRPVDLSNVLISQT